MIFGWIVRLVQIVNLFSKLWVLVIYFFLSVYQPSATPTVVRGFTREKTFQPVAISQPTTETGNLTANNIKQETDNKKDMDDIANNHVTPEKEDGI